MKNLLRCGLLLVIFGAAFCAPRIKSEGDRYAIRSIGSYLIPLVLQADHASRITLEMFHGGTNQLWRLENGVRPGVFAIINLLDTGKALMVAEPGDGPLYLYPRGPYGGQSWTINFNGLITNNYFHLNMAVNSSFFETGSNLILQPPDAQSDKQKFFLMKIN